MKTKQVPWEYSNASFLETWKWETPHFVAYIKCDSNVGIAGTKKSYMITVEDITRGRKHVILNDMAFSFKEASEMVLEKVSKSYPANTNYREYAGDLATTFTIADGRKVNFANLEGHRAVLTVHTEDGRKNLVGSLQVKHYQIELTLEGGNKALIPPVLIFDVHSEDGSRFISVDNNEQTSDRTVKGIFLRGCTGKPGYFSGTIEHEPGTDWCPIHRV